MFGQRKPTGHMCRVTYCKFCHALVNVLYTPSRIVLLDFINLSIIASEKHVRLEQKTIYRGINTVFHSKAVYDGLHEAFVADRRLVLLQVAHG